MKRLILLAGLIILPVFATANNRLDVTLKGGLAVSRPNDEYDLYKSGFDVGISSLYGSVIACGVSFDYIEFRQEELIITDETGPTPLGTYTPKTKGQFYAFSVRFAPRIHSKISPYIQINSGILRRTAALWEKQIVDVPSLKADDKNRFAFSIEAGVRYPVKNSFYVQLSGKYFRTTQNDDDSEIWPTLYFNAVQSYLGINLGVGYAF